MAFRVRNKKKVVTDTRVTLDVKHQQIVAGFEYDRERVGEMETELVRLRERNVIIQHSHADIAEFYANCEKISQLERDINRIKTRKNEIDYYLNVGDLLFEYYNKQEKCCPTVDVDFFGGASSSTGIQNLLKSSSIHNPTPETLPQIPQKRELTVQQKIQKTNKSNSILYLIQAAAEAEEAAATEGDNNPSKTLTQSIIAPVVPPVAPATTPENSVKTGAGLGVDIGAGASIDEGEKNGVKTTLDMPLVGFGGVVDRNELTKEKILDLYLSRTNPDHVSMLSDPHEDDGTYCLVCAGEKVQLTAEAITFCPQCGNVEHIMLDCEKPSYKDPPKEIAYFAYKRINHFREWLNQFQAKESTEIPTDVYDTIRQECRKTRTDINDLTAEGLKKILQKRKLTKYYEHIPHIINRLNGKAPPRMTQEEEEKLCSMFKQIQPLWMKYRQPGRRNFPSYSYVLYKFCELLQLDHFLPGFHLLKTRDKLYEHDTIWRQICAELDWEFIRSV